MIGFVSLSFFLCHQFQKRRMVPTRLIAALAIVLASSPPIASQVRG